MQRPFSKCRRAATGSRFRHVAAAGFAMVLAIPAAGAMPAGEPVPSAAAPDGFASHAAALPGRALPVAPALRTAASLEGTWPGPRARTAAGVVGANGAVWLFNRFVREGGANPEFRVGLRSVRDQLQYGWEWDDNNFLVNHFAHPYQGSLYYTAARANGLPFETCFAAAFAGSFEWEYAGEVNHPAVNDWINTSLGGIALGEVAHRVSSMILDNEAAGWSRVWREGLAAMITPVRAANRLVTGEMTARHANPAGRRPGELSAFVQTGGRTLYRTHFSRQRRTTGHLHLGMRYGDAFTGRNERPFDTFDLALQLSPGDPGRTIGRIESAGFLYRRIGSVDGEPRRVLAIVQHFDYYDNAAFQFGNQSISLTWLGKYRLHGHAASAQIHWNGVVLGAAKSDYFNVSGREYDYGPGLGTKAGAQWGGRSRNVVLSNELFWIHSLNGNRADHFVDFATLKGKMPLHGGLGAGAEYRVYYSQRRYRDFPDVCELDHEARAYLSLVLD